LANLKVLQELDSQSFIHHYNTGTNRVVPSYSRNLLLIFLVGITSSSDESWVKCLRICWCRKVSAQAPHGGVWQFLSISFFGEIRKWSWWFSDLFFSHSRPQRTIAKVS